MAIEVIETSSSKPASWIRRAAVRLNQLIRYSNGERSVKNVSTNYTLEDNDTFLAIDTGGITVTLAGVLDVGRRVIIKDVAGVATASPITVSGTIDGAASASISVNYGNLNLISDGVAWFTF